MSIDNNKNKGRLGISLAIAYFTSVGYTVSIPLNDTQWYDLIIEKDGKLQTVQCKCTGSKDSAIPFRSCGGTNGGIYDSILNHSGLDYLFCTDTDGNMFVIPMDEIRKSKNKKQITLCLEPNPNNHGFQTYKFRVQFSFQAP